MAKKISFGLEMKDGHNVRHDLEELREYFDIVKAIEHFTSGKLVQWLEDNYYDYEAEIIKQLDENAPDFQRQLCETLGIEPAEVDDIELLDVERIKRTKEKETLLRQKTSDGKIIANAENTAFNRADMKALWDARAGTIYLCGDAFDIPIGVRHTKYIGVLSTPKIKINAKMPKDLSDRGIVFENVELPEELREKKAEETTPCSKCGTDEAPSVQPEWIIPKPQLRLMFETAFKKTNEDDKICYGSNVDTNALFYMYKADDNGNLEQKLTDEQKNMAITYICGGKYTENELLQMRFTSDMTFGWAFTNDSFCIGRNGTISVVPYENVKDFKSDGTTLVLKDNKEVDIPKMFMYCDYETAPIHRLLITIRNFLQR
ncbi:MAG: hypothetical protein E7199_06555 [Schwartzia succinivorans]|nr:hypothetical protein [Schwartzia succinivorans]